jgi:hypothetical protein
MFQITAAVEIIRVGKGIVGIEHIIDGIIPLQHLIILRSLTRSLGGTFRHHRCIGEELIAFHGIAEFTQWTIGMTLGTWDGTRTLCGVDGCTAVEATFGGLAFGGVGCRW